MRQGEAATCSAAAVLNIIRLRLALTQDPHISASWRLSIPCIVADALAPRATSDSATPDLNSDWVYSSPNTALQNPLSAATALLATSILTHLPDPFVLKEVAGPADAVKSLVETYANLLRDQGNRVRVVSSPFLSRVSYATRASLRTLLPAGGYYQWGPNTQVTIANATMADLDALVPLHIAFRGRTWAEDVCEARARASLAPPVASGLAWLVRVSVDPGSPPVGYIVLGRVTPRTIAIRSVFVSEAHRRKGVGETMVRAVTRYYLGLPPYGVKGIPESPPAVGCKEEVYLNVVEASAERMYKRVGFLLPDWEGDVPVGGVDPVTGRKAWYSSAWRGVEHEEEEEEEEGI